MNRDTLPNDDGSPSEDITRYGKRRRVALACDSCRERKVRCDGKKPVCGPCEKRDDCLADCGYNVLAHSAKRTSEQEYIASLRQQIRELQRAASDQTRWTESPGRDNGSGLPPLVPPSAVNSAQPAGQYIAADDAPSHGRLPPCISPPTRPPDQVLVEDSPSRDEGGHVFRAGNALEPTVVTSPQPQAENSPVHAPDRLPLAEMVESPQRTATGEDHHGPSPISAMGATMPIQDRSSTGMSNEFYGESSLVSLLREMVQPPSKRGDQGGRSRGAISPPTATPTAAGRSTTIGPRVSAMLQVQFALPPREVTDRLLGLYFDSVHIFYPWTHSLSFRDEYERLWSSPPARQDDNRPDIGLGGSRCPRRVFFTALNAMLALGCEFSDVCPKDKEAASAMFFDRMKSLLQFDVLDSGSISHVQALLLVGQYLLCTHYPTQCWNVVGLACRMAIGLGLQLDHFTDDVSKTEKEIRCRVWYGCVQMDMTVSMTLGRPPSLYLDEDVPLPLPIDDVYMPLNAPHMGQPEGTYSIMMFTVENIKLAKLLGKILERVYQRYGKAGTTAGSRQGSALTHDGLNVILHIDSQLEDFADSLPPVLRWDMATRSSEEIPPTLKRQSNVLRARFLHMKVLLHRPSFTSFCASAHSQARARGHRNPGDQNKKRPRETEFAMTLRTQCALVCVRKTCELVQSLRNATTEDATGAWWFTVFYLITSAVILILTECTPSLKYHLDEHALGAAWEKCLETLRLVSNVHPLAGQYLQSLTLLRQRSLSMFNGGRRQSSLSTPASPAHRGRSGAPTGEAYRPPTDTERVNSQGGRVDHMVVGDDLGTEGADWQYHNLDGAAFDFPDMWESDLNNFMLPTTVTGADGLGYPVSSLF